MSGLKMKYFVLNPQSKHFGDKYAQASRKAMRAYADHIYSINEPLASDLREWSYSEDGKEPNAEEEE